MSVNFIKKNKVKINIYLEYLFVSTYIKIK